jgi:hypothetical protein
MLTSPLLAGSATGSLLLTLSADANNVNVIDELEAIYGAGCCNGSDVVVVVTILPDVQIWSSNYTSAALDFHGFDFGASLLFNNYGNLYGTGGAGNGGTGGPALQINRNITINNTTTGRIFGGGGGGGQGGWGQSAGLTRGGGGGGGGGQGRSGGALGAGQAADVPGADGTAGSASAAGTYGAGGYVSPSASGGRGGVGAGWGATGEDGSSGYGNGGFQTGSAGGSPGKAVYKSGSCTITWTAGNNSTQVKGVVD